MNKIKYIILVLVGVCTLGCEDEIDKYYGDNTLPSLSGHPWIEFLEQEGKYTRFLELLEETGVGDSLDKKFLYTVWAPSDEALEGLTLNSDIEWRKRFVYNHFSQMIMYGRNLDELTRIGTVAGKYLPVEKLNNDYYIDDIKITTVDQICQDGVVHTLDSYFELRPNLYEWLESLGDEYSIFRDSLLAKNYLFSDIENSPAIGNDNVGQIIYDTVKVLKNPILEKGNLRLESELFTFFVMSNDAITNEIDSIGQYLINYGYTPTTEDTLRWFDWILKSSIHRDIIDVTSKPQLISVHKNDFRLEYQKIDDNIESFHGSNGRGYILSECRIARNIHYERINIEPRFSRMYGKDSIDSFVTSFYEALTNFNTSPCKLQFTITESGIPYWKFISSTYDADEGFIHLPVMPGKYKILARLDNYVHNNTASMSDSVDVCINDLVIKLKGITPEGGELYSGKQHIIADSVFLGGKYEPVWITFRIPQPINMAPDWPTMRLAPGLISLIPIDNY